MTITAGNVSSSFDVDIIDNTIQDGDKMFTITITRLISSCLTLPATVNFTTTVATIIDDEGMIKELAHYMHKLDHLDHNRVNRNVLTELNRNG